MTVPAQVLAAVRSIPHPRQEADMTAAVPDPRFRDQLAEALCAREGATVDDLTPESRVALFADLDALMPTIAAEVEARVQAAANQRAAEERAQALREAAHLADENGWTYDGINRVVSANWLRDLATEWSLAAALASPAPAPRAEGGQR